MAKKIAFSELRRLEFANSKRLPQTININGERHQWVGIGWVNEGELHGDEVLVIDDAKPQKKDRRGRHGSATARHC